MKKHYDKENDIFSINFGDVVESMELFDGRLILDFDKKQNIVGFEIFNFMEEVKKNSKRIDNLFKKAERRK